MRISIRRCLSMLRNTSDGNELAVPATNAYQTSIVLGCWYTVIYLDSGEIAWVLDTVLVQAVYAQQPATMLSADRSHDIGDGSEYTLERRATVHRVSGVLRSDAGRALQGPEHSN